MATIFELAAQHRAELLAGDARRARRQIAAYSSAWNGIRQELETVLARMAAAQAEGKVPAFAGARVPGGPVLDQPPGTHSVAWLYQARRLEHLEAVVRAELERYAAQLAPEIEAAQGEAVDAASTHAAQLIGARAEAGVGAGFAKPTDRALAQLVGHLSDGSPLTELLDALPGDGAIRFRSALIDAVTRGRGPREVAREVRDAMGGNLARALTVMRTEQLRAYREATRLAYEANPDVVEGWLWQAALDRRTCACCWAMHGTAHPVTDRLDGHPNCRCTMVPLTKTWAELGAADVRETRAELEPGADAFRRLSEADQRAVLGPRKLAAYQRGDLDLEELVGRRDSDQWGTMRYERSLTELERLRRRGSVPRHLGEGIPKVRKHPAGAGAREIALAEELETTVEEVRRLRATLGRARAGVRAEARATQADALGRLEARGEGMGDAIKAPPRAVRRSDALGRSRMVREGVGGEYDFLERLDTEELKRLRRWWMRHDATVTPDELAESWARTGRYDSSANAMAGIDEWLATTRTADAAGALARGKLPSPRAYSGQVDLNDLAPETAGEGWDIARLFDADEAEALRHTRQVLDEMDELWRYRYGNELLEEALTETRQPVWSLSAAQYRQELEAIYRQLDTTGTLGDDDLRRLAELVPRDVWEAQRDLTPDELYRIMRQQDAGDDEQF